MRLAHLAIVAFGLAIGALPASGQSIFKDAGSALKGLGGGSGGGVLGSIHEVPDQPLAAFRDVGNFLSQPRHVFLGWRVLRLGHIVIPLPW